MFRKIEISDVGKIKESDDCFLNFNMSFSNRVTEKLERLTRFGNHILFNLLCGCAHLYVDDSLFIFPR